MTHHKGFYRESEAEFISTLALIRSDDPYLRLAGYLEIDNYMDLAMRAAQDAAAAELEEAGKVTPIPEGMTLHDPGFKALLRKQAAEIQQYLKERPYFSERTGALIDQSNGIAAEIYQEDSHPIDNMPAVNEAIGEIADVGWETQAAVLKEHNYDGMALLYLQYFDGMLYGEGTEK